MPDGLFAEFTITIPMPPSVNGLYRGMGKNRRRTPKYAEWADEAGWRLNEARAKGEFRPLTAERWYWTDVALPANHIGDSDNRLKALHDLLHSMGATPDDRWLLGGTYMRSETVLPGTCRVHAMSIADAPEDAEREIQMIASRVIAAAGQGVV
jgi:hypothetical protein